MLGQTTQPTPLWLIIVKISQGQSAGRKEVYFIKVVPLSHRPYSLVEF